MEYEKQENSLVGNKWIDLDSVLFSPETTEYGGLEFLLCERFIESDLYKKKSYGLYTI